MSQPRQVTSLLFSHLLTPKPLHATPQVTPTILLSPTIHYPKRKGKRRDSLIGEGLNYQEISRIISPTFQKKSQASNMSQKQINGCELQRELEL
jgi:hypothetical protein